MGIPIAKPTDMAALFDRLAACVDMHGMRLCINSYLGDGRARFRCCRTANAGIAPNSAATNRKRAYDKLGINSRAALFALCRPD
jgi:hypothetical protein